MQLSGSSAFCAFCVLLALWTTCAEARSSLRASQSQSSDLELDMDMSSGLETGLESGLETGLDSSLESMSSLESGSESSLESGLESGSGLDLGSESSLESGLDLGSEATTSVSDSSSLDVTADMADIDASSSITSLTQLAKLADEPAPKSKATSKKALRNPTAKRTPTVLIGLSSKAKTVSKTLSKFDQELQTLEASILQMAQGNGSQIQNNPLVSSIDSILQDKMKGFIKEQFERMSSGLDFAYEQLINCSNKMGANASLTASNYHLPKMKKDHQACRIAQENSRQVGEVKRGLAGATKQLAEEHCRYRDSNETQANKLQGRVQCDKSMYDIQDDVRQYIQDQADFWMGQYEVARYARERCENSTKRWKDADHDAETIENATRDKTKECSEIQAAMEEASCDYRKDWTHMCMGASTKCHDDKIVVYRKEVAEAEFMEKSLKDEMMTIQRIACYLEAAKLENITESIEDCKKKSFAEDAEVKAITFNIKDEPEEKRSKDCDLVPSSDWANEPGFKGAYYAKSLGLQDSPCAATCCKKKVRGVITVYH